MTLVRRHLVAAAATVLALAVGVALGAGPLSHEALLPVGSAPQPRAPAADPGPSADDLAEAAAPTLHDARLRGRGVALLSTPGVDRAVTDAVAADVEDAEGVVVGRWRAGDSLVNAGDKALVDTLGSQLQQQLEGRGAARNATAYRRMGQLIATAVAAPEPPGTAPDRDAMTIRQSIDAASLLSADDEEARLAPLVLVLLGRDLDDHVVADLVGGLASRTSGVVVAARGRGSDLEAIEDLGSVTTVDGIDGAAGRLAAVLALARAEAEPGGSYGASGSDGMLPLG